MTCNNKLRKACISGTTITKGICHIGFGLCLLISQAINAAYFENLSIEHGLSQSTVFDIQQDQNGYLWIATHDGLNRYDGVNFKVFSTIQENPDSRSALSNYNIYRITPDKKGNFWISTHYGLNHLNTQTYEVKYYLHDPKDPNSLINNTVRNAMMDKQGQLWLATYGGLDRFDPETETFHHYPVPEGSNCPNIIRALIQDRHGNLWLGANENGLCHLDPSNKIYTTIDYRGNSADLAPVGIRVLHEDTDGTIWIGTMKGLFHYNPTDKTHTSYFNEPDNDQSLPGNWVQTILKHDDDHFWVGTTGGVGLFNKKLKRFTTIFKERKTAHDGLSNETIYSLYYDHSGLLWIGSDGGGLDKYNPKQNIFKLISAKDKPGKALVDPAVWEVSKAFGYLWVSTSRGLNRYNTKTGNIKHYLPDINNENSLPSDNIYSITPGRNRDLWVGTQGGLSHFHINDETFENYRHRADNPNSIPFNNIVSTSIDRNGLLWLCSFGEGMASFDPGTQKFTHYKHDPNNKNSISHNFVYDIHESKDGYLWLGTFNGLDRFNSADNTFKNFKIISDQVNTTEITVMNGAHNGNILIGTPNGLSIFDPTKEQFKVYSKKNGLEDDYIYAIEEDRDNHIWVSTNRGLSRINPHTDEVNNFDINDGLQGYEFNATASFNDGKYLYFGGFNGLNYFDPDDIAINPYIPPVVITNFSTKTPNSNNSSTPTHVNLSYQDNYFTINFATLDYANTKRNRYAYKLEGFDNDWTYSGNHNFATYTNLDGGDYTFRVKGANKYGVWNQAGASMQIHIDSPPWERWWAYTLYIIAIITIVFFIIRYKTLSDSRSLAERLRRMSTSLTQTLNLETIQNQLANHMQLLLPYRQILICIIEDGRFREGLNYTFETRHAPQLSEKEKNRLFDHFKNEHHPLVLESTESMGMFLENIYRWEDKRLLIIPLIARKHMVGFVMLVNPKSREPYHLEDISIAVTLCAQASTAIDNAQLFRETKQLAFYDHLTGLANRRLFKERLEQVLKTIQRNHQGLAVMLLDLDHFKRVNDSLGHETGDLFLKEAANRLLNCVRIQDTVARIGGDEFTILLTDVDGYKAATTVAQKILAAFSVPIKTDDYTINLSTSIGISLAPKDSIDANTLMKNADVALYKVKDMGRNNYQFFTEEMNVQASQHLSMESELHRASENNEFEIHYQPLIDINTNTIRSVEALIRWNHPSKGLLLPSHFISYAEETGFIKSIGEWVIKDVITFAAKLFHEHQKPTKIIVNLSTKQIIHGYLIDTIQQFLNKFNLDSKWFGLEITENSLIQNTMEAIKVLSDLKKIGITIAIDDFGTGYSSLSYLKRLPIDIIKIDRSFINGIPDDNEDIEIASAIIAMSHKLGLKTVAEGVETSAQLEFLKANQCDMAQGFYLYKPVTADELIQIINENQQGTKQN